MEEIRKVPFCRTKSSSKILKIIQKIIISSVFALATAYAAQLKIFLPWTPVPITLQTLIVLLSGVFLGKWWGSFSQILYVSCGILGVPLFAGMGSGLAVILGPRGGYLIGFILISFFIGHFKNGLFKKSETFKNFIKISLIYSILIYGLGCLHLGFWIWLTKGSVPSFDNVLALGAIPFIPGDLLKIFVVSKFLSTKT